MLDEAALSTEIVADLLSRLKDSYADGLHPHMLECLQALSLRLYLLFARSLHEGALPTLWKISIVTPLFKNGNRCDPLNYRLVSLTSVCCKVLEQVIVSQLVNFLELNGLFSVNQLCFRKGRSVEDSLLITYAEVVIVVESDLVVDIFLHFSKAFDVVSLSIIL